MKATIPASIRANRSSRRVVRALRPTTYPHHRSEWMIIAQCTHQIASSNLIDKTNQMELLYAGKIKGLEEKVMELENEDEELREKVVKQNSWLKQL